MTSAAHENEKTIELLLSSISNDRDTGLCHSFFFGKPGTPLWDRRIGVEIYYNRAKLIQAALNLRKSGPAYLRYLPIGDIWSMLQNFMSDYFSLIADDVLFRRIDGPYSERVSIPAKVNLVHALSQSSIFVPKPVLTLFPLVTVQISSDFESDVFFFIPPKSLPSRVPHIPSQGLAPEQFPPLQDWKGRVDRPLSLLGVRSPVVQAAKKMKAAILGALALTPMPRYRHMFSMRRTFGGICTISESVTYSPSDPHTPPLMHDIILGEQDHAWLSILADKLVASERSVRRQIRALEYYYRAWPLDASERFPILCMTLDAVFGDSNHATGAVIDGVRQSIGDHVSEKRLRQLMDLRASVIHGGAPDVYDSRKYAKYYDAYEADPIHDIELVVARCLRNAIFGDAMQEHSDPNEKIIAEAQALGRLPKKLSGNTIRDSEENFE